MSSKGEIIKKTWIITVISPLWSPVNPLWFLADCALKATVAEITGLTWTLQRNYWIQIKFPLNGPFPRGHLMTKLDPFIIFFRTVHLFLHYLGTSSGWPKLREIMYASFKEYMENIRNNFRLFQYFPIILCKGASIKWTWHFPWNQGPNSLDSNGK